MSLPLGWAVTTLGDLTAPTIDQGGPTGDPFSYVDISSIDNKVKRIVQSRMLPASVAPSRARQRLQVGDVLVSMTRPNLNAVAILPAQLAGAVGSTGFCVLRALEIDPGWLYYAVQTHAFVEAMCRVVQGALYPAVRPRDVLGFCLPLPPYPEQRRIVAAIEEHLSLLDAAVAALTRVQELIPLYRAAVLMAAVEGRLVETEANLGHGESSPAESAQMWLGGLTDRSPVWTAGALPGWVSAPALSLTRTSGYGTSEKCEYDAKGPPVLRIPNVDSGRIALTDVKHARRVDGWSAPEALAPGDLLVIRTNGSRGLIGRAAVVSTPLEPPHYFASYLIRLRLLRDPALWRWVGLWWNSPTARGALTAMAATSAGQYNISLSKLERLQVPVPPKPEAERIVAEVDRRLSLAGAVESEVEASLARAARLRQALLKRAFEGKLVPQDPTDEPASVLLERIRASRLSAPRWMRARRRA